MRISALSLELPMVNRTLKSGAWIALVLIASVASAVEINQPCMNAALGSTSNCTANDLTFVAFDLGVQDDGCVSMSDTTSVILRSVIENTTAQDRYDVGLFFSTDGSGSAAAGGQCAVDALAPSYGTIGATACPPLNLSSDGTNPPGQGPFDNADGDFCGDLKVRTSPLGCDRINNTTLALGADGLRDPATTDFDKPVAFSCNDVDADGFLTINACLSWGQQVNEVDGNANGMCDSVFEVRPGNKSKCQCTDLVTRITVPRLSATCSCASGTNPTFGFTDCTISYLNSSGCTPDTTKNPRDRCGTASLVDFLIQDGGVGGSFTTINDGNGTSTGGSTMRFSPNGDLTTTVGGTIYPLTSIIGPGNTGSITFRYTIPTNYSGTINLATNPIYYDRRCSLDPGRRCTINADCGGFGTCDVNNYRCSSNNSLSCNPSAPLPSGCGTCEVGPVVQAAVSCPITINAVATAATVTGVAATPGEQGGATVSWETASETGTIGFHVDRFDPSTQEYRPVTRAMVPSVLHPAGGRYEIEDPSAPAVGVLTYRLREVETGGGELVHGPYRVAVDTERARLAPRESALPGAEVHPPSERLAARIAAADGGVGAAHLAPRAAARAGQAGRAKLLVDEDGIQRVSVSELARALGTPAATVRAALRAGRIALSLNGQAVAWEADGDGLVFFGQAVETPYTRTNVYWAELAPGLLVEGLPPTDLPAGATAFRDTAHGERDLFSWHEITTDPAADFWFWATLLAHHPVAGRTRLDVTTPDPAAAGPDAVLRLATWGWSGAERYRAHVSVNGYPAGNVSWSGQDRAQTQVTVPQSVLRRGNVVEILAVEGGFFVDAIDVTYERRYRLEHGRLIGTSGGTNTLDELHAPDRLRVWDLSDPLQPRRVAVGNVAPAGSLVWSAAFSLPEGAPFVAADEVGTRRARAVADTPSRLLDPANRGDYVILTGPELADAARELADYRAASGLEPIVVHLEDVMDEVNGGVFEPHAVTELLAWAAANWELPPTYVALLGRGHFDYLDHRGLGGNLMPPILGGGTKGVVPTDAAFGDLDGDGLPELAVGRIPVVSSDELRAYLSRVAAYEAGTDESWRGRILAVADDPDHGGDFPRDSTHLETLVGSGYAVEPLHLGGPESVFEVRRRLLQALHEGTFVTNFVGHGGLDRLAAEGLLTSADVPGLEDVANPTVLLALTCNVGMFAVPGYSCLAEDLVVSEGGAIAVVAPTGLSFNDQAVQLGQRMLPAVAAAVPGNRLGDAVIESMRDYVRAGGEPPFLRIFNIFGDPALQLRP